MGMQENNLNFHPAINAPDVEVNDAIVFRSVKEHPEGYWVAPIPFEPKPERDFVLSWLCQENGARLAKGMNPLATVNYSKGQVTIQKGATLEVSPKVGRNDPCPCGSNKKYKKCCGN